MKLGPVTKLDKRNKTKPKKIDDDLISANCDVIVIFLIYGQFGAIQKPDSRRIVCKTSPSLTVNWKQKTELKHLTQLSHYRLGKGTVFAKKCWFLQKKTDTSRIKRVLVLKGIFSETTYARVITYQISIF